MSLKSHFAIRLALLLLPLMSGTGCGLGLTEFGPSVGIFAYPVPVSPFFQDEYEDKYWEHERYARVPVLAPLLPGGPQLALDPPSDDEVLRALEKAVPVEGGLPMLHENNRNNIRIVKEKISDYIDPPRHYPLIGPAQLHHAHYKCTIYYTGVTHVGWPIPHTLEDREAVEVIYIDHNHFHRVGDVDAGTGVEL